MPVNLRRLVRNLDWTLIVTTAGLLALSAVMVYSATATQPVDGDPRYYLKRQVAWIGVGLAGMAVAALLDYNDLRPLSRLIYLGNLGLLAAVLAAGRTAFGHQSWLALGPFQFQPSETAKLALILTLADHLARREAPVRRLRHLFWPLVHVAVPMGLILLQPDLGTALVFVAIWVGMLFLAGASVRLLGSLVGGGLAAAAGAIVLHFRYGLPLPLKEYQLNRLIVFLDNEFDPLGAGYNLAQSKIAIGAGRLFGQGLFQGSQSRLNFLPNQHTDFIFSVIGEELGFAGGAAVLLAFGILLFRGLMIARNARDAYGFLLAGGIVAMWTFQVLQNAGMALGIMPITGIPLPFVSYGGSALFTNCAAVGLLLNVWVRRHRIQF